MAEWSDEEARGDDTPISAGERLVLALDGFEGPIDMLLSLAREQKVDLSRLSILQLADQYLDFVAEAGRVRLELAADYLVMAAWLAYLKSRLLLPEPEEDEPSGIEMAEALAFQLRRLEAMRDAAERLFARPRLGHDVFARGAPEAIDIHRATVFKATLYDLLKAYGEHKRRLATSVLRVEPLNLYSIEDAVRRLSLMVGRLPDWTRLSSFLPREIRGSLRGRSALAAHFAATLELAKAGEVELRQDGPFGPIWVRRARRAAEGEAGREDREEKES